MKRCWFVEKCKMQYAVCDMRGDDAKTIHKMRCEIT